MKPGKVRLGRFERPTSSLGVRRSIRLSYRRKASQAFLLYTFPARPVAGLAIEFSEMTCKKNILTMSAHEYYDCPIMDVALAHRLTCPSRGVRFSRTIGEDRNGFIRQGNGETGVVSSPDYQTTKVVRFTDASDSK